MAKTNYDPDGYNRLITDFEKVVGAFSDLRMNMENGVIEQYVNKYINRGGELLADSLKKVQNAQANALIIESYIIRYQKMMEGTLEEGDQNISSVESPHEYFPRFSDMTPISKSERYNGYISYEWNWQNFDFARDYSDIYSFMNSSAYKFKNAAITGRSEWDNSKLYWLWLTGNLNEYTDELLENSLMSTLDAMADTMASEKGLNDEIKARAGKNYDTIINELSKLIENTLKEGGTKEQLFESRDFKQLCQEFDYQLSIPLKTLIEKSWNNINGMFKTGATIISIMNYLDPGIKAICNVFADYSHQIAYLDTMQNALLAAGYPYGPVHKVIKEAREKYNDVIYRFSDDFAAVLEKSVTKSAKKAVAEGIPIIGDVDRWLGYFSKSAKLFHGDTIAADKALMGLKQYDAVLTNTYEKYQKMISDGVASQADMKEADRIFRILCTTKQQEYKNMMTMCSKGSADYQKFQQKYNELTEWLKKANQ